MSLLDGLKESMMNPLFDAVEESDIDIELDFELAIEAVIDKQIALSDSDIAAILDDDNPDNLVSDLTSKDENISKIADDAIDDDLKSLESMLNDLLAFESDMPDDPGIDPESTEGCGSKACEMDDDDDEYDDDDDDYYLSLDSLLSSVFKN
jgi:hypothetical protein